MSNKISIITVVFNDVQHIRKTMESYFSQTWEDKEYIVIDGGSTDGTVDIIREYSDRLVFWCSEKDDGIYDAMNKGISHATGDWINFLNSGDSYASEYALEATLSCSYALDADIIYGNSIKMLDGHLETIIAPEDIYQMEHEPIFRHGSSLIRTSLHKQYMFDLKKYSKYHFALDWYMIHQVYKAEYTFRKVNVTIQCYQAEGVSNHPFTSRWYNYKIATQGSFSTYHFVYFVKSVCIMVMKNIGVYQWLKALGTEYIVNDILPHIPFWWGRKSYLNLLHCKIGRGSFIMKKCYILNPWNLCIGNHSHINRDCIIDARNRITIGNNVSISHRVSIMTGSHNKDSRHFDYTAQPIVIDDYVWIGIGSTILQGVHIGCGAVVCAGAVVNRDIAPFTIVGGVPAKVIGSRRKDLDYECNGYMPLT